MYKLLNKIFGWDYVFWRNTADNGVARVIRLPDGSVGYWRYRSTRVFDEIKSKNQVMWLTCKPEKYIKE